MVKTGIGLDTHERKTRDICYELDGCRVIVHREFSGEGTTILQQVISMLLDMMEAEKK